MIKRLILIFMLFFGLSHSMAFAKHDKALPTESQKNAYIDFQSMLILYV